VIHDPALLERLSAFAPERFDGEVFRATRRSLDPLAASTSGGRWAPKGLVPVLYTSLLREGALAEISYQWSQLTPPPSRPALLHRLGVSAERRLRLLRADLEALDVDMKRYESVNYHCTQEIGAAVAFLGCDGLLVPSARWSCENLIIFTENHPLTSKLEVLSSEEIDWRNWAQDAGFFNQSNFDEKARQLVAREPNEPDALTEINALATESVDLHGQKAIAPAMALFKPGA
jgi:RES domain-containing protein